MVAVVHETLRNVFHSDSAGIAERTEVNDTLVSDKAFIPRVKNGVGNAEALSNVVSIKNRHLGGFGKSLRSHHGDIHP